METFSALLAICVGNSPVHKGQWRGSLMFSLIWVWINGWVNNREAGGLRRYCTHYDVIVMFLISFPQAIYATWIKHDYSYKTYSHIKPHFMCSYYFPCGLGSFSYRIKYGPAYNDILHWVDPHVLKSYQSLLDQLKLSQSLWIVLGI